MFKVRPPRPVHWLARGSLSCGSLFCNVVVFLMLSGRLHAVPSDHTLCMPSLIRMVCKKALASITTKQWRPASPNGRLLLILPRFFRLISSYYFKQYKLRHTVTLLGSAVTVDSGMPGGERAGRHRWTPCTPARYLAQYTTPHQLEVSQSR